MKSIVISAFVLAMLGTASEVQAQAEEEEPQRTVLDGVYTAAQAVRGEEVYQTICVACHEDWEFMDAIFHQNWADQGVYFLAQNILTLMPDDNPGILTREEVSDVLAYIMKLNSFPEGETELPIEDDPLRTIIWKAPASPGR